MKLLRFIILNILNLLICLSCSIESVDIDNNHDGLNTTEAYQKLDISYGADVNQTFDLYLPAGRTSSTKTIILVHGGGWTSGDKSSMSYIKDLIQLEIPNIAIANINYRLADSNNPPYPMQNNDITTIINYLKINKVRYSISDKIGFIGTSAGGHLSLLWSYAFDTNSNVNMVCSIVGPTNFTDPAYLNNTNPELQPFIDAHGANPTIAFLEEISPYHQVTSNAPSSILFYGGQDPLVPPSQGTDLRDKLLSLNVNHQFILYPNEGHGWTGLNLLDTWTKLKAFILNNL
ncbi:alpha/beta hydrolase [Seonamhaeicola aphaedonensis]|uniref:Acetyl esterase/lipase n=1 Tax=Seonamhaeicola aphaedonensis TaxID=1461338 RepID=A0A3D9HKJ4_9FLAO|nr:alpha/beta hydrolase [Seonamhaeicola aphaedonensis]RED49426.1 acetyl esterase/lipase [Seonamhaeicola aphaedonensis]